MKRAIQSAAITAVTLFLPLGAAADHHLQTITQIVAASGGQFDKNDKDFDILLNAVIAADLTGALDDPEADLTVFAPTDDAFIRLARNLGYKGGSEADAYGVIVAALTELSDGDPIPLLRNILLYHVSAGSRSSEAVSKSGGIDTLLSGATILPARTTLLDNDPDLKDARIITGASDIQASNGIIHVLTRVMIPLDILNPDSSSLPTITELVVASGGEFDDNKADFDILLNAVLAAGLADALNNPDDSLTVLAPNDKAFIKTARDLGFHGDDEGGAFAFIVAALTELGGGDPIPLLQAILTYHVIPEAQTNKQVLEADFVETLLGAGIYPDALRRTLGDNEPTLRDPFIYVFKFDNIRASNGFIQTIGRVLIPVDLSTL